MTKATLFGILDGLEKVERKCYHQQVSLQHARSGVAIVMSQYAVMLVRSACYLLTEPVCTDVDKAGACGSGFATHHGGSACSNCEGQGGCRPGALEPVVLHCRGHGEGTGPVLRLRERGGRVGPHLRRPRHQVPPSCILSPPGSAACGTILLAQSAC